MTRRLEQREIEDLSAWLDGELAPQEAHRLEQAVAGDAALAEARRELQKLDELLEAYTVPAPADDLADRVASGVRRARRQAVVIRLARWLVPAAAAAAVIIAAVLMNLAGTGEPPSGTPAPIVKAPTPVPSPAPVAAAAVSFFENYDVLVNMDTLEAIDRIERAPGDI